MKNLDLTKHLEEMVMNMPSYRYEVFYRDYQKLISFMEESVTYVTKENRDNDNIELTKRCRLLGSKMYLDCLHEMEARRMTPFQMGHLLLTVKDTVESRWDNLKAL